MDGWIPRPGDGYGEGWCRAGGRRTLMERLGILGLVIDKETRSRLGREGEGGEKNEKIGATRCIAIDERFDRRKAVKIGVFFL